MQEYRLDQRWPRLPVAEYAVVDAPVQRFEYRRRRCEIHVGHPKGQHVAVAVLVPLGRVAAAAVDDVIEVEIHGESLPIAQTAATITAFTGACRRSQAGRPSAL